MYWSQGYIAAEETHFALFYTWFHSMYFPSIWKIYLLWCIICLHEHNPIDAVGIGGENDNIIEFVNSDDCLQFKIIYSYICCCYFFVMLVKFVCLGRHVWQHRCVCCCLMWVDLTYSDVSYSILKYFVKLNYRSHISI